MSNDQNKAIARRFFRAFEANDRDALKEVLAPDLAAHVPHVSSESGTASREELLQTIDLFHAAFSDQHYDIEDQVAEGDKVVTRTTWRATHSGEFQGLPPTGNQVTMTGIAIERIKDGKIVERWLNMDQVSLMQQLGLIPSAAEVG